MPSLTPLPVEPPRTMRPLATVAPVRDKSMSYLLLSLVALYSVANVVLFVTASDRWVRAEEPLPGTSPSRNTTVLQLGPEELALRTAFSW